jgi:hypothetical protein
MALIAYEVISIKFYECILVIQHAMRMYYIVVCGLSYLPYHIFSHYLTNGTI